VAQKQKATFRKPLLEKVAQKQKATFRKSGAKL